MTAPGSENQQARLPDEAMEQLAADIAGASVETAGSEAVAEAQFAESKQPEQTTSAAPGSATAEQPVYCTECGAPNRANARYCRACGQSLEAQAVMHRLAEPPTRPQGETLQRLTIGAEISAEASKAPGKTEAVDTAPKRPAAGTARRERSKEFVFNLPMPDSVAPLVRIVAIVLTGAVVYLAIKPLITVGIVAFVVWLIIDSWRRAQETLKGKPRP